MSASEKILTQEQVDSLFGFCKKHYVQYYDVQVELVDHLVNAVEDEMKKDGQLSFETALEKVYAGFGYAGFAHIVDGRIKSMSKSNGKLRKQLFYSYFTWPKATMLACVFLLISLFQQFFSGDEVWYLLAPFMIGLMIYDSIVQRKTRKQLKKQKRSLLVTATGMDTPFFSMYIIYQAFTYAVRHISDPVWYFVTYELLALLTVVSLAGLLAYRDHIFKLIEHAEKEYPAAFA